MIDKAHSSLGIGIYSRTDVARLLKMTPSRIARWIRGYTYWLSYAREQRHAQPPVVRSRLPDADGAFVLSFLDLMELRVIRDLVDDAGLSLQQIRAAAAVASKLFRTTHPFAARLVYHDRDRLFVRLSEDAAIELSKRHQQLVSAHVFEPYLKEIDFNPSSSMAERWWPLGRDVPVVLDPRIAFGAPVVAGTAIRTDVVAALAECVQHDDAARSYGIDAIAVEAAVRFENELRAAA